MIEDDENDDIICLDSDCEPSTQLRIKNKSIRAPPAPINPNCDVIANCSPIKKRKILDKENKNPKKSKKVKEILNHELQPAPVVVKKEIQSDCEPSKQPKIKNLVFALDNSPLADLRIPYR